MKRDRNTSSIGMMIALMAPFLRTEEESITDALNGWVDGNENPLVMRLKKKVEELVDSAHLLGNYKGWNTPIQALEDYKG